VDAPGLLIPRYKIHKKPTTAHEGHCAGSSRHVSNNRLFDCKKEPIMPACILTHVTGFCNHNYSRQIKLPFKISKFIQSFPALTHALHKFPWYFLSSNSCVPQISVNFEPQGRLLEVLETN